MTAIINPYTGFRADRFTTAIGDFPVSADAGYAGYTVIGKYAPTALHATGSSVRLTISGYKGAGISGTLSDVFIGLVSTASGANAYDFDSAPTRITFAGGNSVTLTTGVLKTSDEIAFTIDGAKAVLIAYNVAALSHASLKSGLTTKYVMYRKSGIQQAGTAAKAAGYTANSGVSPFLFRLECAS
jgi:hypothetical protein